MGENSYEGIDLASGPDNLGCCFLRDDGTTLTVEIDAPSALIARTAIDCPFGSTEGFESLLHGEWPREAPVDGFKSRKTEIWLRDKVDNYGIVRRWRTRTKLEKKLHPGEPLFNRSRHIQPTLGMLIVPQCLWYIANRFNKDLPVGERKQRLVEARRGEGLWVEAHPRMFLFSMLERMYRASDSSVELDTLFAAAQYKNSQENRSKLYRLFREQTQWMGTQVRDIRPATIPEELRVNNHCFDAFLCALTAWAHQHGECIGWKAAKIAPTAVDIEGHILVLRETRQDEA